MAHLRSVTLAGGLTALLLGCSLPSAPDPYQSDTVPEAYLAGNARNDQRNAQLDLRQQSPEALAQTLGAWWTIFEDPMLDQLVSRALTANWSLRTAAQRIEQAQAQVTVVNAMARPTLSTGANGSRQQSGTTSKLGFGLYDLYGFSANFAWEPDLFGRVAARAASAQADVSVETFEQRALMVSVVAELVETYAQLRAFQHLRALMQQYIAVLQQQVTLTEQLARTGLAPVASVAASRSNLLTMQSQLPALEARIDALITTTAVLTGSFPRDLDHLLKPTGKMLTVQHPIPLTLPSQLLTQRPDIAAQQARMQSSLSQVQAANADFMPTFSIPLGIGYSTSPLDLLLNPASFIWNIAAAASAPLYTGDALEAQLQIAQAINREDQLQYEGLVRQALKEVENTITDYQTSLSSLQSTQAIVREQQQILAQQQRLFQTGQSSRLQLNQAKMQLLSSQQALTDARYSAVIQLTMLYRALGGGWVADSAQASTAPHPA